MVLAIIAGNKTQTRRVVKPQPDKEGVKSANDGYWDSRFKDGFQWTNQNDADDFYLIEQSPYGMVGDRIWVRETWQVRDDKSYYTKADCKLHQTSNRECAKLWRSEKNNRDWRSPIFMPRWASRMTLGIVNIRVERLHEIKAMEVICEGVQFERHASFERGGLTPCDEIRAWYAFSDGWDKLNAKRGFSWDSNPWVWVIEFKNITA